ncbi:MAG TPA: MFS transporter [Geminicoccus sp.]|jgi:PAT family beta-lactamase induction signal transducer AmpG|uniref:AmpG family muropeptide MFS transporter n=1 Tax=Geminicoccus sp. TaxID=2024832 RepID=UPI002E365196|nr:MFS transporter [Geminicoccus sp.]HEX2524956.1 MFS transporter [Geminicoccus sp.]
MKSFFASVAAYRDRRILFVLLLGFSSGLPLLLVLSTLSARLRDAEISTGTIGLFAYVLAPYTFKFAWAPLVDRVPVPGLTRLLGRRRSWLLVTQAGLIGSIAILAQVDPAQSTLSTAWAALAVAFFAASQDIVIDAWRVEVLPTEKLGAGAAVVVVGYRIGMFVAGAGALFLADRLGWAETYTVMAWLVLVGVAAALLAPEPSAPSAPAEADVNLMGWFAQGVVAPFKDFFARRGTTVGCMILLFISLYKASDVMLTLMANPFYLDLGFTKTDIAEVSGTFGLFVGLFGGVLGGVVAYRLGLLRALLVTGLLQGASNLTFAGLAVLGPVKPAFYAAILVENLTGGMGTAVFVAYLSSLCTTHFTATQYALLTSFMQLFAKFVMVPSSGFVAEAMGWPGFFVLSALLALPGLGLVLWLRRQVEVTDRPVPRAGLEASSG